MLLTKVSKIFDVRNLASPFFQQIFIKLRVPLVDNLSRARAKR